jgi:hypothetical protein
MDAGLTIRPTAGVAETAQVRPEPIPARGAVSTELAPSQSVLAAANAAAARNHQERAAQQQTTHDIVIDPAAREVIFRVVDVRSNRVVRQVPDQAMLRMRVYTRAIANGETPSEAAAKVDIDMAV